MFYPRSAGSVVGSKAGASGEGAAGKGPASQPARREPDAAPGTSAGPAAGASTGAAASSSEDAAHEPGLIEIVAQDSGGKPLAGAKYRVEVEQGKPIEGTLDAQGYAKVEGVGKKECVVSFPELNLE